MCLYFLNICRNNTVFQTFSFIDPNYIMIIAQCAVCQELFDGAADTSVSALPCGHVFHTACIDMWFKKSYSCPQCRVKVKPSQIVKRLYFCHVDAASTSMLLSHLDPLTSDCDTVSHCVIQFICILTPCISEINN